MDTLRALAVKRISVNQRTREVMRNKFVETYKALEAEEENKGLLMAQSFHDYINYVCAEFELSPKAFYYLSDYFGKRRTNDIDVLHSAMAMLYKSVSSARIGNFRAVKDEWFGRYNHLGYSYNGGVQYDRALVSLLDSLYPGELDHFRDMLMERNAVTRLDWNVSSKLEILSHYLVELLHYNYTTLEDIIEIVSKLVSLSNNRRFVGDYDMEYVMIVLLITKNSPYLELGLTLSELSDVCDGLFHAMPKLQRHWDNLILCKLFECPVRHIELLKLLVEKIEEPEGI